MLVSFAVRNFRAFYDTAVLSMTATREQHHGNRVARVGRTRILPVAAIYGANAAGKSTLISALEALRTLVVGVRTVGDPLPIQPNLALGAQETTVMAIEVVVWHQGREHTLAYEVEATGEQIISETLTRIGTRRETLLLERHGGACVLHEELATDQVAQALANVVDENQTLVGAIGARRDGLVRVLRDWFATELHIIYPTSEYLALPSRVSTDTLFATAMNQGLSRADTGVSALEPRTVPLEELGIGPSSARQYVTKLRRDGGNLLLSSPSGDPAFVCLDEGGNLRAQVLMAHHHEDGADFTLSLAQESDGTRRFMHLLPVLFQLSEADTRGVFVIDELENSLHPHLTEELVARFLTDIEPTSRRQLLFTSHEVSLMKADLLRRDEMWITDKHGSSSTLTSVSQFTGVGARKGADLYSLYMSGRLGGTPHTGLNL